MDFLGIHLFYRWREVDLPTKEDNQGGGVTIQGTDMMFRSPLEENEVRRTGLIIQGMDMMFRNPLEENIRVTVNAVTDQEKHSIGIGHLITMTVTVSTVTITEDTVIDHYRSYETRRSRNRSPDFYVERHDHQRSRSPDYHQRWGREECVRSRPTDFYDRYPRDYRGSERSRNWSPSSYNREEYRAERDVRSYPLASDQMTTKEEDRIIIDTLMKIYDDCHPEVIRASVEHPENWVKPFDKSVLMERCLLDLRT